MQPKTLAKTLKISRARARRAILSLRCRHTPLCYPQMKMKIATFNINSIRVRLPVILGWLEQHQPDVLCLQETKVQDSEFPALGLASTGYHVVYRGMKSYNGVAMLTRTSPDDVVYGLDEGGEPDEACIRRGVRQPIASVNLA